MEPWKWEVVCISSFTCFILGYMFRAHREGPLDHLLHLLDVTGEGRLSTQEISEVAYAVIQYKGLNIHSLQDAVLRAREQARLFKHRTVGALAAELVWLVFCLTYVHFCVVEEWLREFASVLAGLGIVPVFFCFYSMQRFTAMSKSLERKVHLFEDYGSERCTLCGEAGADIAQHGTWLICLCAHCKVQVEGLAQEFDGPGLAQPLLE
uniref:EF-hand domain-containing protein n=1 Tax=Pyrodinium bahamense TaxID=73915 RepID=A0A7S0AEI6_9DINO|mmetsp:Transcript_3237/g.8937  ORF Transcript_3237/g.8937 Transcript_3237/m.8937 type:complete len:208 (+) Transcript_3237:53-676(+)